MQNISAGELLIIVLVLLLLFGAKKIPEFMRGLTEAAREFRKGMASEPESKKESSKSSRP